MATEPFVGLELTLSRGRYTQYPDSGLGSCELRIGRQEGGASTNLTDQDIAKALKAIHAWFNIGYGETS